MEKFPACVDSPGGSRRKNGWLCSFMTQSAYWAMCCGVLSSHVFSMPDYNFRYTWAYEQGSHRTYRFQAMQRENIAYFLSFMTIVSGLWYDSCKEEILYSPSYVYILSVLWSRQEKMVGFTVTCLLPVCVPANSKKNDWLRRSMSRSGLPSC